jgi:hypothetical protein
MTTSLPAPWPLVSRSLGPRRGLPLAPRAGPARNGNGGGNGGNGNSAGTRAPAPASAYPQQQPQQPQQWAAARPYPAPQQPPNHQQQQHQHQQGQHPHNHPHPHYDARALHDAAEQSNEAGALQISALLGGVMALMVLPWAARHPAFLALPTLVLCAPGAIGGGARSAAREAAAGVASALRMAVGLAAESRERAQHEEAAYRASHPVGVGGHHHQHQQHQQQHNHQQQQQGPASAWPPPPDVAAAAAAAADAHHQAAAADPRLLPREERERRFKRLAEGVDLGRPAAQNTNNPE